MKDGSFVKAVVRSIHVARTDVDHTYAGHSACFALSSLTKKQRTSLRKGMVALVQLPNPTTVRTFQADIVMLKGEPVTVTKGRYNATAHILHLKKTVKVVDILGGSTTGSLGLVREDASFVLRPGNQARVTFKFTGGPAVRFQTLCEQSFLCGSCYSTCSTNYIPIKSESVFLSVFQL